MSDGNNIIPCCTPVELALFFQFENDVILFPSQVKKELQPFFPNVVPQNKLQHPLHHQDDLLDVCPFLFGFNWWEIWINPIASTQAAVMVAKLVHPVRHRVFSG